jgi:energy-coupling factor transporter ATP-binding protein EcfA2
MIDMSIESLRNRVDRAKNQYESAHRKLVEARKDLKGTLAYLKNVKHAQELTQTVAQTVQQQAHSKIACVVTACLQTVFDDKNYTFEIRFERKRKRTEAKLLLYLNGHEIDDPIEGESGGVLDVASFALQLSAIMLTKPTVRRLMVMDEPFKYVSPEYRSNVQQMLTKLAEDFDIQLIMVTSQQSQVMAGKVVDL